MLRKLCFPDLNTRDTKATRTHQCSAMFEVVNVRTFDHRMMTRKFRDDISNVQELSCWQKNT